MTMKPDTEKTKAAVIRACYMIWQNGAFRPKPLKSDALGGTAPEQPDSPDKESKQPAVISEPMMFTGSNPEAKGHN